MKFEDNQIGPKYRVEKLVDPAGKHDNCQFFVLDPEHDVHARDALRQYAIACKTTDPTLSGVIAAWLSTYPLSAYAQEQVDMVKQATEDINSPHFDWASIKSHGDHCPAHRRHGGVPTSCTCIGLSGDHTK